MPPARLDLGSGDRRVPQRRQARDYANTEDRMTTCFVSGAGGFVGHHFLEHVLASTDWDVVATDSFRHKGKTDRIAQVLAGAPFAFGNELTWWRDRISVITHDLNAPFSSAETARLAQRDI